MGYETLRYAVDGPIATITFARPERMNAFTARVSDEFEAALREADEDDAVRAVIITAEGRVFCAGADLSGGGDSFDMTSGGGNLNFQTSDGQRVDETPSFTWTLLNMRKPTITAFNGSAVGVGLTLSLPTDIRLAARGAKFGFVFTRRGLIPEAGCSWYLPRLVGLSQAIRWCVTGMLFSAEEALAGGLVSEVLEPDALLPRARAIAADIAANTAPVAVALTRQLLWRSATLDTPVRSLALEAEYTIALGAGDDVREGVGAFLEKRPPRFTGSVTRDMPGGYPWWDDAEQARHTSDAA